MLGRCYACTQLLTAADGPNMLGCPDGAGTPRQPFHLRCWVRLQAAHHDDANRPALPPTRQAA